MDILRKTQIKGEKIIIMSGHECNNNASASYPVCEWVSAFNSHTFQVNLLVEIEGCQKQASY